MQQAGPCASPEQRSKPRVEPGRENGEAGKQCRNEEDGHAPMHQSGMHVVPGNFVLIDDGMTEAFIEMSSPRRLYRTAADGLTCGHESPPLASGAQVARAWDRKPRSGSASRALPAQPSPGSAASADTSTRYKRWEYAGSPASLHTIPAWWHRAERRLRACRRSTADRKPRRSSDRFPATVSPVSPRSPSSPAWYRT